MFWSTCNIGVPLRLEKCGIDWQQSKHYVGTFSLSAATDEVIKQLFKMAPVIDIVVSILCPVSSRRES